MRCIYINLASATRRRAAIEASFAACAPEGWSLERFEAVRAAEVSTPGAISPAEKACFLSHRDALATVLEDDEPVFMLEDDVVFSRFTARVVSDALDHPDWDLLFTDVAVTNEGSMARLARLRRELVEASRCDFLDLSDISFAGSAAYVVSGQAKRRLWEILCSAPALDGPYDLVLRELLRHRMITARVAFPFVTSISAEADDSQIQRGPKEAGDLVYNYFRRLMFVERDLDDCRRTASLIARDMADEEARLAGVAFAGMLSPKFPMS